MLMLHMACVGTPRNTQVMLVSRTREPPAT